ncbi:MAG: hypothetical protein J2P20_12980 [Pseudonocardia sp.]|nr:hypothetical protein [Pseudonocardia sp.]
MTDPTPFDACHRTREVGAYLLGSLTPAERHDYAAHLPDCLHCLREVGQLAGLPGLLARSPGPPAGARLPAGLAEPGADERIGERSGERTTEPGAEEPDAEPSAVVAALAEIRRRRSRRRALVAVGFVLVAAVAVGATTASGRVFMAPATGVSAAGQLPVPMQAVGGAEATATLALNQRPWGTEVVMRCRYEGTPEYGPPVYVLVATAADGTRTELARWTAVPNQDIVLATATDLQLQQLTSLEVRVMHGKMILRTDHI